MHYQGKGFKHMGELFPYDRIISLWPIGGRVDRASATDTVDSGSIPGRVKPKTIKIGIHSFPA